MARELEQLRQVAQGQVRRPIRLRPARPWRGNRANLRNPVFPDLAADRELAQMIEQSGRPKRGGRGQWRSIEREFVAGECVHLTQHDERLVGFRPEWRRREPGASLFGERFKKRREARDGASWWIWD